jgi:mannosyltransferase
MAAVTGDRIRADHLLRDVLLASGLSLVLGAIHLGGPSLWVDESFSAGAVDESWVDLMTDNYHWLYYWLLKPLGLLAGTSEWTLRLPSVVGAAASAGLLVVVGHRFFDRRVALAAGLALAANPFVVKWSQQARGYTLLLALSLLAVLALDRALERPSRKTWAVYGLAFTAIVVWHPAAGLVLVPAHAVLAYQRRESLLPHGLLAAVLVCSLGLPWAGQIAIRSSGPDASLNWLDAPTLPEVVSVLASVSGVAGLGLVLGVVGSAVLWRAGARDRLAWLAAWAAGPFAVALAVTVVKPVFLDRYLVVAAPAFALLVGVALVGVGSRLGIGLTVLVVSATTLGLAEWYGHGGNGNWRGEDWRGAVETVLDRRGEADAIVVAEWSAHPAAEYYGANVVDTSTADSIWVLAWSEEGRFLTRAERIALGFGDHRLVEQHRFGRRLRAQLWSTAG